eukprot:5175463-Amphidinium_carterae.1
MSSKVEVAISGKLSVRATSSLRLKERLASITLVKNFSAQNSSMDLPNHQGLVRPRPIHVRGHATACLSKLCSAQFREVCSDRLAYPGEGVVSNMPSLARLQQMSHWSH